MTEKQIFKFYVKDRLAPQATATFEKLCILAEHFFGTDFLILVFDQSHEHSKEEITILSGFNGKIYSFTADLTGAEDVFREHSLSRGEKMQQSVPHAAPSVASITQS